MIYLQRSPLPDHYDSHKDLLIEYVQPLMENNTRLQQRTEMQLLFWIAVLLLILTQRAGKRESGRGAEEDRKQEQWETQQPFSDRENYERVERGCVKNKGRMRGYRVVIGSFVVVLFTLAADLWLLHLMRICLWPLIRAVGQSYDLLFSGNLIKHFSCSFFSNPQINHIVLTYLNM